MNTSTGRPNSPRGSPLETARESILNTPLWLPLAVAALALLVLDVVVPANSKGAVPVMSILLGLAVAAISIWVVVLRFSSQHRHRTLLQSLTTASAVAGLSVLELHDLVLSALFRRDWGIVDYTIAGAPDDMVVMTSDRARRAVFFEAGPQVVNVDVVRSREAAVRGQARLVMVSGGSFGPEAIVFARQIGADLVDAEGVLALMSELRRNTRSVGPLPAPTFVWEDEALSGQPQRMTAATTATGEKACPDCGSPMKSHSNATTRYWACSRFPDCAGLIVVQSPQR